MKQTTRIQRLSGFTIVELMVGLAIGLLLALVIVQVMSVVETQTRTTTGSAEAQTNGGIALFSIAREIQLAGYPLTATDNTSPLECTSAGMVATLTPLAITEGIAVAGTSPASDSVTIHYGSAPNGGIPHPISTVAGNNVTLQSNLGCVANDIAFVINGTSCGSATINSIPAGDQRVVVLDNAVTAGAIAGANLACIGVWQTITYAVNNGNLERNGVPILAGIINIQAQYGITAAANSNQIIRWVNAKNIADWDTAVDGASTGVDWGTNITVQNRNRIKAIRLSIVARNDKIAPSSVSSACSSTTTALPTGICSWEGNVTSPAPVIDLSPGNPSWQQYRYRTFETIIPMRNVIWAKDSL